MPALAPLALSATLPRPVPRALFERLMGFLPALPAQGPLAVAVSGGPDSMALLVLLQEWASVRDRDVLALTVDHGLRTASALEARQVAAWCQMWGLSCRILRWEKSEAPRSALHEQARTARYQLLRAACAAEGAAALFLAHHRGDQAETVLMRLARRTGLDGAAAMPCAMQQGGLWHLRPLLPVTKDMLEATCTARHVPFVRDPSNENLHTERARLRAQRNTLERAGLGTDAIYAFAAAAGACRSACEQEANDWFAAHAHLPAYGALHMDRRAFETASPLLKARLLSRALGCLSGQAYPPRGASLSTALAALAQAGCGAATLSGCRIEKNAAQISVLREEAAAQSSVLSLHDAAAGQLWDNRFRIMVDEALKFENVTIRALGGASRARLEKMNAAAAALPARHRAALPALFVGETLIAVPEWQGVSQSPVSARFLPKNPLCPAPFLAAPPLSSVFGVV